MVSRKPGQRNTWLKPGDAVILATLTNFLFSGFKHKFNALQ